MKSITFLEEVLNLPELLDRVENDEELLFDLFALLREDLPASREALQRAIEAGDLHEIERAAHRLKGMLANLSARNTRSLASEIESAARASDVQKIRELKSAFELRITAFAAALDLFMTSA
jgi:two-component system, sensor histidine kinase and response regulator